MSASPPASSPPLAEVGKRLGQFLLDQLLFICTFGIGWLIWSVITWERGQTPAMRLMNLQVRLLDSGLLPTRGAMAIRELAIKIGIPMAIGAFFQSPNILGALARFVWIGTYFMILWTPLRQELWDRAVGTVVVDLRENQ
ncbi:MAG: RDD family protein [Actinobacteria bacterium]|nr:RDD family protein [Actinomycetota bacterium]